MLKVYMVDYLVDEYNGQTTAHFEQCLTEDGVTTVADFPRMLAARWWGDPERASRIEVIKTELIRDL